jgi:hypothetical protein
MLGTYPNDLFLCNTCWNTALSANTRAFNECSGHSQDFD